MSDWDQFANALAWYKAAPARWLQSAKQDLTAAAEWIWEVIQGDFHDEHTTAQVVTGTIVSMIPFVDQICDVRDVVANCKKINEDSDNTWSWVALVLTLIGLFPTLGSLVKGCLKILFAYGRKAVVRLGKVAKTGDMWKLTQPVVEKGIKKLNQHLNHPAVRKTLAALKIDNPWKYLADQTRTLKGKLTVAALIGVFDKVIGTLSDLLDLIKKWGNASLNSRAGQLLKQVKGVRDQANAKLAQVLKPVQDWLDSVAKRLDVEADMNYRASTNAVNPHSYIVPEAKELAEFEKKKPEWVDKTLDDVPHMAAQRYTHKDGWPDMRDESKNRALKEKYNTFETGTIQAVTIPPGETLYRVVAPNSYDNNAFWMRKAEFEQLKSKAEWRRKFAVWANWNSNGEYVTYTVPPGKGLNVWEGKAASQEMKNTDYKLEGGSSQIALDPAELQKGSMGKRQPTGWGYGDFGNNPDMTGIPVLKYNWYEKK